MTLTPMQSLMKRFGAPMNREDYLDFNWLGNPPLDEDELPAELEIGLPAEFQRQALDENELTDREQ